MYLSYISYYSNINKCINKGYTYFNIYIYYE